jgi:hypothetical protein
MRTYLLPLYALLLFALAGPALAVDGVLEINETCAVETGCFAGDTAGFPVRITAPGSYRLTSNLTYASPNQNAIFIEGGGAGSTIDLNGFAIVGPATCERVLNVTTCSGTGTGNVSAVSSSNLADGVTVKNGRVQGAGRSGISLGGRHSRIEGVHATQNGSNGLRLTVGGVFFQNRAYINGGDGIQADEDSIVSSNIAFGNAGDGINAADGAAIIQGNNSSENNEDGIVAGAECLVKDNVVTDNKGFGLNLSSPLVTSVGYTNNIFANNIGTVAGGIDLGGNLCNGTTTCP